MAVYLTAADLYANGIPQATIASLDSSVVPTVLANVSALADSYLRARYPGALVPPYPPELVSQLAKIAAYEIMAIRGYMPEGNDTLFKDRKDDAIAWLKAVQADKATLSIASSGSTPIYSPNVSTTCKRGW